MLKEASKILASLVIIKCQIAFLKGIDFSIFLHIIIVGRVLSEFA